MSVKVFKVRLTGDQKIYWLTERQGADLMAKWEAGVKGAVRIGGYGTMVKTSAIRQIYTEKAEKPYPPEFERSLAAESGGKKLRAGVPEFSILPTETVLFAAPATSPEKDTVMSLELRPRSAVERAGEAYWVARCHYREGENGERQFLTTFAELPSATLMLPQDGYPHTVGAVYRYGVRVE